MEQCQAHYVKHQEMTKAAQTPNAAQMPKGSMPAPPPKQRPAQLSDKTSTAGQPRNSRSFDQCF